MSRERWESLRADHATRLGSAIELEGIDGLRTQLETPPSEPESADA